MNRNQKSFYLIVFAILISQSLVGQTHIKAEFKPNTIYPDQLTHYVVTLSGKDSPSHLEVPQVDGLMIVSTSNSKNVSLGTGRGMSIQSRHQFTIRVNKEGKITIPAYSVEIGGKKETVPAATLNVLKMDPRRQQALNEQERKKKAAMDDLFSLELELPVKKIYLGQAVPIDIKLYIKEGVRVLENAPSPQKVGDSFTTTEFSNEGPRQERVRADNGAIYNLITWKTIITSIKSGPQALGFSFEAVIGTPSQNTRRRRSFFDNFFDDARYERQQVMAYTDDLEVEIHPLPKIDQPQSFTGGIGRFSMNDPELSDTRVQAGEPVTFSLEISGKGNFDRINPPILENTEGWQVYDPEEQFVAADTLGYHGNKRFDYTIIPQNKNVTQTPSLTFSYFDPESGKYITYSPKSIPIEVLPAKSIAPIQVPVNAFTQNQKENNASTPTPQHLLPLKLKPGKWVKHLNPIFASPVFLAGQVAPLVLILGLFLFRKKQLKHVHDTTYARKLKAQKALDQWLRKADHAAQANEALPFHNAAVRCIQELIGGEIQQEAESLTLTEIESYLIGRQADPELLVPVRDFFDAADAIKFSGGAGRLAQASDEFSKLKDVLVKLAKMI